MLPIDVPTLRSKFPADGSSTFAECARPVTIDTTASPYLVAREELLAH